jgi:(p)ppGpp synthase/HD superfamily hydrolase
MMALAGYLHDVVEDTDHTAETLLAAGVPDEVVAIVLFTTDEPGVNRRERKSRTYQRVRQQLDQWLRSGQPEGFGWVPRALRVKVADRLANVRASLKQDSSLLGMYRKERRAFRDVYYVPGVCNAMWVEYDRLLGG